MEEAGTGNCFLLKWKQRLGIGSLPEVNHPGRKSVRSQLVNRKSHVLLCLNLRAFVSSCLSLNDHHQGTKTQRKSSCLRVILTLCVSATLWQFLSLFTLYRMLLTFHKQVSFFYMEGAELSTAKANQAERRAMKFSRRIRVRASREIGRSPSMVRIGM
jgi:hypothetical protein